jgi:hypothetical protein
MSTLEEEPTLTSAGAPRKVRSRPELGRLLMECPYCQERLQGVPRGWVCPRCRSTVGVEAAGGRIEEGRE